MIALLTILVVSTSSFATFSNMDKVDVWQADGCRWERMDYFGGNNDSCNYMQLARAWKSKNYGTLCNPELLSGYCNRQDWVINLKVNATVAQWIRWSIDGNQFDWQVHKPGKYVAEPLALKVRSNEDVDVKFSNFTNLVSTEQGTTAIPIYWAVDTQNNNPPSDNNSAWKSVNQLNSSPNNKMTIPFSTSEVTKYLWHKIDVSDATRASDYQGTGRITLSVTDLKYFIDGDGFYLFGIELNKPGNWNLKTPAEK